MAEGKVTLCHDAFQNFARECKASKEVIAIGVVYVIRDEKTFKEGFAKIEIDVSGITGIDMQTYANAFLLAAQAVIERDPTARHKLQSHQG